MRNQHKQSRAGLGLIELIAMLAVVALIMLVVLPYFARARGHRNPIKCVSILKNVGLAFRIYATDNNDLFPAQGMATIELTTLKAVDIFRSLSNELSTPKIVMCPSDNLVREATNWTDFDSKSFSYFASLSASETNPAAFLAGDRNILANGIPVTGLLPLTTNIAPTLSWSKEMHVEQGNIAMADGSVQQMGSSRLKQSIRDQDLVTNYLAFP